MCESKVLAKESTPNNHISLAGVHSTSAGLVLYCCCAETLAPGVGRQSPAVEFSCTWWYLRYPIGSSELLLQ